MWLSKCRPTFVQISNILKVCVQNVLHVLECKLEDVDATAWPLQGNGNWKCSHFSIRRDFSGLTSRIRLRYTLLQLTPNLIVYRVEVRSPDSRLLAGHRAGAMKSGVRVNSYTFSHWLLQHNVTSVRMTAVPYVTLYWKRRYFVIDIGRLITPQSNNIF